ncbi:MAG: thiamine pyrophosphate-dependent enzyme, partial [Priestia megaterium]
GNSAANKIAQSADLIIGVGTRFTDFTTSSKLFYAETDVLTINISEFHASKLEATKIVADAKVGLEALSSALEGYKSGYETEIEEAKLKWNQELTRLKNIAYTGKEFIPEIKGHFDDSLSEYKDSLSTELVQTTVLGKVNELIAPDSIITCAAGSLPGDLQRMWISNERNTYHLEYGYSCMGYEIASALGAKMAEPDKEVYAMVGDGSYLMLHSELVTSIQEGIKINIVLFDNSGFGCINNLQMDNGIESFGTEFRVRNPRTGQLDGDIMRINFAQSGAAYGAKTYEVYTMEELEYAIEDSKKQSVSTLIDIKVLPKTMTDGYDSWWHVGVAAVSESSNVQTAFEGKESQLQKARKY